jgi:hypothetical protein
MYEKFSESQEAFSTSTYLNMKADGQRSLKVKECKLSQWVSHNILEGKYERLLTCS